MSVSMSVCYLLAATSPISIFLNFLYTPLDSCRGVAMLSPALSGNPLYVRKYGRGSNWRSQCTLSVCMHVQTTRVCKIWSACRSRSCLLKIQVDGISAVPGDISLSPYMLLYAYVQSQFHTTGNRRMDSQLLPVPYIAHALCSVLTHLSGIF